MRLPTLTGEFRLTQDPELRFTPAGKAVCSLSMIASESKKNPQTDEWEDGDKTPFISVSLWEQAAEQAAEVFTKGERVLVTGQLYVREYERREGGTGQSIELKWATVAPVPGGKPKGQQAGNGWSANGQRPPHQQQQGGQRPQQGGQRPPQGQGGWGQQQQADPWATNPNSGHAGGNPNQDPWATPGAGNGEPPF